MIIHATYTIFIIAICISRRILRKILNIYISSTLLMLKSQVLIILLLKKEIFSRINHAKLLCKPITVGLLACFHFRSIQSKKM